MWNWLKDCVDDKCIDLEGLEEVMKSDKAAHALWREFASDPKDFIHDIRDEVAAYIEYLKDRKIKGKDG